MERGLNTPKPAQTEPCSIAIISNVPGTVRVRRMESDRGSRGDCRFYVALRLCQRWHPQGPNGIRGIKRRQNRKQRYIPNRFGNVDGELIGGLLEGRRLRWVRTMVSPKARKRPVWVGDMAICASGAHRSIISPSLYNYL